MTNSITSLGIVGAVCLAFEWDRWLPFIMLTTFLLVSLYTFVVETRASR